MSFKCQILPTRLTFNNNVFVKNCDVRLVIILCVISAILPIIKCAKLENPQIRLLINDDDLLQDKTNIHEAGSVAAATANQQDNSGEHFNLYRSELKRLSYETIHRILRDENEPSYRREDTELRYYQKRSPSYESSHQLIKRSAKEKEIVLNLSQQNLTEFCLTPGIRARMSLVSSLDLSHNYISQLNTSLIANITTLTTLNLQNNSFTSIPLCRNCTLRTVNLNNNLIQSSQLPPNIYLRNLYLSANLIDNLSSLQLSLLKNLESLDISHNLLRNSETSFFTERMHNLKHLNLAYNQLGSIDRETFYNLLSLNTLLLSHNTISDIDYETFLALPNLQYLDLSFNGLRGKSIRALQGITGLVVLNMAFNPLIGPYMQEFVASWSLKELDASGTGLCQIPAALAQSVRSLKLTHNWLKVINCGDLDSYPLLQYLDLSYSHIEHIEDDALGRLEILEILMLDHNGLSKVPYSLPVSLEHLFLQNNNIMEIPQQAFQGLNNLKTLDLSHNKLLYLPDIMLPKLQTLNLQSSEIRGISQGIIHSLPQLNDLMLEDNPIKCADLLGIAEWASTCRLRVDKENEREEEEDNFVIKIQDLKNKFEKMHNFYEQFGFNNSIIDSNLLAALKPPACVQENSNLMQTISQNEKLNVEEGKKKDFKATKFNQNSTTSSPLSPTTEKTLAKDNNNQTDAHGIFSKEKEEKNGKLQDEEETAVKTIILEKPTQVLPATMQSSIVNEKQTTKSFNATTTTAATSTNNFSTTTNTTYVQGEEQDIVVKPKFENEMKTFIHLAANANSVATTTATTITSQQHAIPSIGNTSAELQLNTSTSNMTELVHPFPKLSKETAQKQLKDIQHKTMSAKSFQKIKSKKWLKQDSLLNSGGSRVISPRQSSTITDINEDKFIKLTTSATPINTKTPATILANPITKTTSVFKTEAAVFETSTMAETNTILQDKKDESKSKSGGDLKEQYVNVVNFESTTSKLEINLEKDQQKHEIKTKIAPTKEIKSLATQSAVNMQTQIAKTEAAITTTATTMEPKTTNKRMAKITLKIPPEPTANLDKPNKLAQTNTPSTSSAAAHNTTHSITKISSNTKTTAKTKPAAEEKHELETTKSTSVTAAATRKTFQIIEAKTTAATTSSILVKDKDLASNYNDNDNNRQITKTINKTSNILPTTTTTTSSSSEITTTASTSGTNENNQTAKTFDITTTRTSATTAAIKNIVDKQQRQQQSHLLENMMPHYRQSLEKDVNVKCMQSNSTECTSTATTTQKQQSESARTPTMEVETLEKTTAAKTSTEIPTAAMTHKHEPLQLLVKDRHLIGTPLLMHKGENLMVTADELILPKNNSHNAEQEGKNSSNNANTNISSMENIEQHHLEPNTMAGVVKDKHNLEKSQTTRTPTTTVTIPNEHKQKTEHKLNQPTNNRKDQEAVKREDPEPQDDLGKIKKINYEMKSKKPSLIMKKMTIITKQHEDGKNVQPSEPLENEVHAKQFDNSHYQELKPLAVHPEKGDQIKHSTVNTPIISSQNNKNQHNSQAVNLLKQPQTFQHEHELLLQQILQDQQADTHAKLTKTEQWSDLRRAESKENHPGLILLVSSGLFLVLLLGLMHVYRCDMPWRRHSPSHHLRPHQIQNHSLDDDSHSFLNYSDGMQKWHHSARLEAPYNSPLHHLHVRELQKTSATEKPATVKSTASNFRPLPITHSFVLNNTRSLSQSSTTTTSTASASSSAILDDESFYIEMTPDSGQYAHAIQSELLPMELLNMAQIQNQDHQENMGDSQTSMEDECVVHYQQQQQQQRHQPDYKSPTLSSASAVLNGSPSLTAATKTSLCAKPQTQSRKFGMW